MKEGIAARMARRGIERLGTHTLKQIADEAGVSVATVWRDLNRAQFARANCENSEMPTHVLNSRGQLRPTRYRTRARPVARRVPDPDLLHEQILGALNRYVARYPETSREHLLDSLAAAYQDVLDAGGEG